MPEVKDKAVETVKTPSRDLPMPKYDYQNPKTGSYVLKSPPRSAEEKPLKGLVLQNLKFA